MTKNNLQKLELTWIGKGEEPKLEPRILIENPDYSYGDPNSENILIHGDNLLALKALEQEYAGKVKCIYIDPPYNTGAAIESYNDNLEHSTWLSLMITRLQLLRNLLRKDGSIWISIDDDEGHYLKILCDEVLGRQNFINTVIWEKKYSPQNDAKWLSDSHDFILVYAKNKEIWRPFLLPRSEDMNSRYKNPDNDTRGVWKPADFSVRTYNVECDYPITLPSGRIVNPPESRAWVTNRVRFEEMVADNRIWFGPAGNNVPAIKKFLSEVKDGMTAMTLWKYTEVGHNQDAKKEVKALNVDFSTPKPERLIARVLTLGSNPGDIILDSFLGSGTTSAVAQKMGRKWIGVELGEHAYTHCYPRLKAVVDGEQGGISKTVGWQGGGGFRFYELAPSLILKDNFGRDIINPIYNPNMLVAAMAKQQGFIYQPHHAVYWKQGKSSDRDFIYTTTQFLTVEILEQIHDQMQQGESLLICSKSFQNECKNCFSNITVKKIPQMLLGKCEFGKDNYNLNIVNLPQIEEDKDLETGE